MDMISVRIDSGIDTFTSFTGPNSTIKDDFLDAGATGYRDSVIKGLNF
jgi:hypothetical protein